MSEPIPTQKKAHGLLAHASRYGPPEKAVEAKATFVAAQLKQRILAAREQATLTEEHRAELAALILDEGGAR